jgi:hypothetical protein
LIKNSLFVSLFAFVTHATGNRMGEAGAVALVRSLPFLTGLQTLLLHGDYFSMWLSS